MLLVRRHRYTRELAFFRCWTPTPVALSDLVAVVSARWHIEEDFQLGKRTTGLDCGQVRTWTSWHRWSTAALTAYAFLAVAALLEHQAAHDADEHPADLVPITIPELRHLLAPPSCPPRAAIVPMSTTGRTGGVITKPAPAPATKPGTPTPTELHDHY